MSGWLTEAQLKWTEDFTGISLENPTQGADTVSADPAMIGGKVGLRYKGDGRGANDPDPFDSEKERDIMLRKLKNGEEVHVDEVNELDPDDRAIVIEAIEDALKTKEKSLTAIMNIKTAEVDFAKRALALQTDANEAELSATNEAMKLYEAFTAKARIADDKTIDALSTDLPPLDAALKAAEKIRADRPKFEKQSKDAADRVSKLTDVQLDRMPATESAKVLADLVAAGKPKGDRFKSLMRLYKHIKLDPAFLRVDQKNQQAIIASLKGNQGLKEAKKSWGSMDPDKKIGALQQIADAQARAYGIPSPKIVRMKAEDEAGKNGFIVEGGFQPSDGMITLNFGPDSSANDFKKAMETIFHETAHAFQKSLADKFKKGELKPDDPLYPEAALFAANAMRGANINNQDINDDPTHGSLISAAYQAQPNERHSFETSRAIFGSVLLSL